MRYVFVADDFTGASDTLATLSRAGLKTRLYLEPPSVEEVQDIEAFGIATAGRSMEQRELFVLMHSIAEALVDHAPAIIHLKVCSTFDSSETVGNIATAMQALSAVLKPATTIILGGQPSLGRYCLFGNLFARGPDGQTHRIDRHPVMRHHPVTPMREADLRQHFAQLGLPGLTLLDRPTLHSNTPLPASPMLIDVLDNSDLTAIKHRLNSTATPQLWVGPSSVAEAQYADRPPPSPAEQPSSEPQSFELLSSATSAPEGLPGPLLVFAGSRSSMTAAQVTAADDFTTISLSAASLADDGDGPHQPIHQALAAGNDVLAVLEEEREHGLTAADVAHHSARLLASIVADEVVGTLLIAGGDTSSYAIRTLAPRSIDYTGQLAPGVALCCANYANGKRLPIIMKGGQMGEHDLFNQVRSMTRAQPSRQRIS
ncbi:four-carbon acid sugar kinase family protein [Halomonas huangheensis]|uniref:Four-carbon acid sugar kinase family protein n=1 Tax=Halomonas huangheensis TaxID=1178482 RepID=W1N3W3_9GAMM|nr:four-carbon acid sugar kinase family protein [Halomonas huangheensis]ALM51714.1 hypothetical protein AR456_04990 [Halomonas huangheensis]ERL50208.1 hypothetical protein BJB45_03515 [Halomonas huangheensis]